jgi:hypothetical protein
VEGGYQELSKNTCKFDKQRQGGEDEEKEDGEFSGEKTMDLLHRKREGGTSINNWGHKEGGDSSNKY